MQLLLASAMVELPPHHTKVEGLSPAIAASTGREKNGRRIFQKLEKHSMKK
jgi:hypothetical protein